MFPARNLHLQEDETHETAMRPPSEPPQKTTGTGEAGVLGGGAAGARKWKLTEFPGEATFFFSVVHIFWNTLGS